jgi:hypothetical protein
MTAASPHPGEPNGHRQCAALLVEFAAERGCEVTASDWRPGMKMPEGFEPFNMRCPHGVLMWMEPTPEQRLAWIRDGVA